MLSCGVAQADVGNMGPGPAPGLCPYPATCDAGEAGGMVAVYWYREEWPVELNGSHRHCYYYGAATQGSFGFSMMLQVGITGPVGGLAGGCHYVCPDGELAAMPNPPGGWKDAIIPTRCKPVGPNPDMPVDVSPPIAEQGAVPAQPFQLPVPPPPPGEPSPATELPSVTNPACPNPEATQTSSC
jgi:hypothetical protein